MKKAIAVILALIITALFIFKLSQQPVMQEQPTIAELYYSIQEPEFYYGEIRNVNDMCDVSYLINNLGGLSYGQ